MAPRAQRDPDIQWLRRGASPQHQWSEFILGAVLMVLPLSVSALHLYLAARWAGLDGLTLTQAWQGWMADINPDRYYSGVYLKAMEQFDRSSLLTVFAVFLLIQLLALRRIRMRNVRLLALLEEHGVSG